MPQHQTVSFSLNDMLFEYDEEKNRINIQKHGISFRNAARVLFDRDRIEFYDYDHSEDEDRYNTIGNAASGIITVIGDARQQARFRDEILFVVYTERDVTAKDGRAAEVTRLISARPATNFERGLYFGNL